MSSRNNNLFLLGTTPVGPTTASLSTWQLKNAHVRVCLSSQRFQPLVHELRHHLL